MKSRDQAQICEINITPLTDVFLVLLIIMMLVTPMMDFAGLPMGINTGDESQAQESDKKPLTIHVAQSGTIDIDGAEIPGPILAVEMRTRMQPEQEVIVRVHPDANYEALAYALSAVYQAGVVRVNVYQEGGVETAPASAPATSTTPAAPAKPAGGA